jgi:hypothetical protein
MRENKKLNFIFTFYFIQSILTISMSVQRKTQTILVKRKQFESKLKEEIRENNLKVKRFEITIINLSSSAGRDIDWIENQKSICKKRIEEVNTHVAQLQAKMTGIMAGLCDVEIDAMFKATEDHLTEAEEKKARREQFAAIRDEANRQVGSTFGKNEHQSMRNEAYLNRTMDREYLRIMDIVSQLPEYISKNLDTMPNNKGYRWRGVIFFGKQPEENNGTTVIFEKKPDGTIIQESTPTSFTEWFKPKEGQKRLIQSYNRKVTLRKPARKI